MHIRVCVATIITYHKIGFLVESNKKAVILATYVCCEIYYKFMNNTSGLISIARGLEEPHLNN